MKNAAPKKPSQEQEVEPTTRETVEEYRATLASVVERCDEIKRWSDRYPVHLILVNRVYKFDGPADVDRFITRLKSELARYDMAQRPRVAAMRLPSDL